MAQLVADKTVPHLQVLWKDGVWQKDNGNKYITVEILTHVDKTF